MGSYLLETLFFYLFTCSRGKCLCVFKFLPDLIEGLNGLTRPVTTHIYKTISELLLLYGN